MAEQYNAGFTWAVPIVKSDTVNFDSSVSLSGGNIRACDAIWVGGAGIVAAVLQNGTVVNFTCAAGTLLPIRAIRENSTDTTATFTVALYISP